MLDITILSSSISLSVGNTNTENFSDSSHINGSLYYVIFQSCLVKHHLGHLLKIEIPRVHLRCSDPDSQGDDPGNQFPASPQGFSYSDEEEKLFSYKTRHVLWKRCFRRALGMRWCRLNPRGWNRAIFDLVKIKGYVEAMSARWQTSSRFSLFYRNIK